MKKQNKEKISEQLQNMVAADPESKVDIEIVLYKSTPDVEAAIIKLISVDGKLLGKPYELSDGKTRVIRAEVPPDDLRLIAANDTVTEIKPTAFFSAS